MLSKTILLLKMTRPVNILIAVLTLLAGYCLIDYYPPVMLLAIPPGSEVQFEIDGQDEEDVMMQLERLFHDNFHEESY
jgi:hypothetical protein